MLVVSEYFQFIGIMVTVADSIGIKLVTADCLLTGVGNELHQYYVDSTQHTIHRKICLGFRCKIYGIASYSQQSEINSQFIVAYGGREVAILYLLEQNLELINRLSLNDWISSVHIYEPKIEDEISFCVVSAHSVASEFTVNRNGKWNIRNKSTCVDKCTLYCSFIIGNQWTETVIFGGTAFGELIIWRANPRNNSACDVLHRLSGHNGVIFSISCSIEHKLITTTSDDRSVKIWNLKCPPDEPINWTNCTIDPSKSMFGHTARIFNHKIIEYTGKVYIITVGEDGNVCVWNRDGRLVNREPIAPAISLWNLEYDTTRQYLFACGNDGNVHQLNLKNILNETQFLCENIEIEGVKNGDYVTKLAIMQSDSVVVMLTNYQKLLYGPITDNITENCWMPLPDAEIGYKITVLETYGSIVATAGYQFMTMYQFENGHFNKVFHSQPPLKCEPTLIRSLKFISEMEFVICDSKGNGSLLAMDAEFNIRKNQQFQMPPSKEPWITVAARFGHNLVIGDRHGNMHLYEIQEKLQFKHTLKHVHGNLGCKTIFQTGRRNLQFECAGHQSKLKTIVINDTTMELELESTHDIPIKWCDKSIQMDESHVLLAGFNERHFVAWRNDNSYRFEIDCGGGHRAWDLHINRQTSKAHLLFVRSKSLNCVQFDLHDRTLHPFNITANNWHSWPCNTMRIIQLTDERFLIASGGDDNLLKFNEITMSNCIESHDIPLMLQHHFDMVLHISNIRSIFTLELPAHHHNTTCANESWLIFSAGGRAQICVTKLNIDTQRNVQFNEQCDFMLRSSDLHRKRSKQTQIIYFDPETRFMSLVAYHESDYISFVVGCSDGFIRTFKYVNGSISLNTSVFYGRCILNVHHFLFEHRNYLISMATDGLLVFWSLDNFNETSTPFFQHRHHESGINAFDVFMNEFGQMYVATGGDDQAILISIFQLQNRNGNSVNISVLNTVKFLHDHTAQVNGVKFSTDKKFLYTISVDQTVLRINLTDFSIKQVAYSCISDAKGIQMLKPPNNILVFGCGMQVMNI